MKGDTGQHVEKAFLKLGAMEQVTIQGVGFPCICSYPFVEGDKHAEMMMRSQSSY